MPSVSGFAFPPVFPITDEQRRIFGNYGSEDDIRETIAARIFANDPSVGRLNAQQTAWVTRNLDPGLWQSRIPERKPSLSELQFFSNSPNVSGMAAEDNSVVLNPYSKLSDLQRASVLANEKARIYMRQNRGR